MATVPLESEGKSTLWFGTTTVMAATPVVPVLALATVCVLVIVATVPSARYTVIGIDKTTEFALAENAEWSPITILLDEYVTDPTVMVEAGDWVIVPTRNALLVAVALAVNCVVPSYTTMSVPEPV